MNRLDLSRLSSGLGAALVLFLLALGLRIFWFTYYNFDGLYGQDAYAYFSYARTLQSAVTHLQSPPPFWWPLGYPALLALAFTLGGVNIFTAQAITVLSGALISPLAYALALDASPRAYRNASAWVAGLICAVGGQFLQSSVVIMADAPALMWAALASWLLLRYNSSRRTWTLLFASVAVALSIWTRWQNLIFATVWFAAWLASEFTPRYRTEHKDTTIPPLRVGEKQGVRDSQQGVGGHLRTTFLHALLIVGTIALILLPQFLRPTAATAPLAGQSWLEGWRPQNFFARSFDTVDGHFDYPLPVGLFYAQVFAHPAYLVALLFPLFALGVFTLLKEFRTLFTAAVLLLGWIVAMYLFLAGIPYQNFRFNLGLFVPIAVVTGIGAGFLWRYWRASRTRYLLVCWIAVSLLTMLIWQPRVLAPVIAIKARERNILTGLQQYVPAGSTVWTLGFSGPLNLYLPVTGREIWQVSTNEITAAPNSFLLVDVANIESQWRGLEPAQHLTNLKRTNSLRELARLDGWTLYQIVPAPLH